MATNYPSTHPAVAITARRAPFSILEVSTEAPGPGEVLIHVKWTASSPADLHQVDGDLVDDFPFLLGCSFAGIVVGVGSEDTNAVSPETKHLEVGDRVAGFIASQPKHAGFQAFVTVPSWATGRIPANLSFQEAVTVPVNLVTAFTPLPSPLASIYHGLFPPTLLLKSMIKSFLSGERLAVSILSAAERVPYVLDCIGDVEGSLRPLTKIAQYGIRVAVVVPTIIRHASRQAEPQLTRDTSTVLVGEWKEGVKIVPVMTFSYQENEFFKWHLQPEIIPELLKDAHIKPNKHRVVDGDTLLERAQRALDLLRDRAPSGERLVWKVSES
ncbi:hypothetical protein FANTH_10144 [Fusarium anthophilum]|uniref:Enoyl reductase (ER) domain-containing protein n=1 Tax=Fusarium anthophilum TaxID=48485 RepID=A0A8H4Z2V2_9HYPO|nr:hypothetical protein FANTH_10144 [Fusarium anthophilum]